MKLAAPLLICVLYAAGHCAGADIDALLARMSLEEKLSLVHGARDPRNLGQAGYWPGLPRLGIPPLRLADGPPGINVNRDATAMPAPVSLAATFDRAAARRYGTVLGREAKALGQGILLAPYINVVRDPLFRRNHTALGEDPYLNGELAAAEIAGIQRQGVMAQAKHLVAYNGMDNVEIDERTLRELYLPAFEAAVRAGVASVMCAYNRVNGEPSCENSRIQNDILRGAWGFQGFVTSDWGALHSPLALTRGVDLEMPGREILGRSGPYFTDALQQAIEQDKIPRAALDLAVGRILRQMDRFGLLGKKSAARTASIDVAGDAKVARQLAQQGAVLLRNNGGILPLTAQDLTSLAVIGPTARQVAAGYLGERAYGFESRLVAPLEALRKLAPQAKVNYSVGNDLTGVPIPAEVVSGRFIVPADGDYTFMVQAVGGEGEILVDGRSIVRSAAFRGFGTVERKWSSLLPTIDGRDNARASVHLTAGAHRIETVANEAARSVRFARMTPELRRANIDDAVAAARSARTAIVFAWNETGSSFALAEDQDELIRRVASANPRTIVILNTGGPVAMPWRDQVQAILQMWYPGQEGGWATADLLLGRAEPGGRLPVTFPARIEDTPARAAGHPERWAPPPPPGTSGTDPNPPLVRFTEGPAVGYRWYDQQNIGPLFPFGHGLSYTRFEYSDLRVRPGQDGIYLTFTLRNTGSRSGAEVVQVYVGPAAGSPAPTVPKGLAAFERIELRPGKSRQVTVHIAERALSHWSTEQHRWVLADGARDVYVGSSSRDLPLRGEIPQRQ